jgi:hypothetical protein
VGGVGGSLLLMMLLILGAWFPLGLFGPGLLIVAGFGILGWAMMRHLLLPRSALE